MATTIPSLPPSVERHAHCLSADERAAVADALAALAASSSADSDRAADPSSSPPAELAAWRALTQRALRPGHPFALHRALHAAVYARWDASLRGPKPVWVPGPQEALDANAAGFMASFHADAWFARHRTGHPARDWPLLQRASVQSPELFWSAVLNGELGVRFDAPPTRVLDEAGLLGDGGGGCCGNCGGGGGSNGGCCDAPSSSCCSGGGNATATIALGPDSVQWLPGARLNIAAAALLSPKSPDGGDPAGGGGGIGAPGAPSSSSSSSPSPHDPWSAPCCDPEAYETARDASPPPALVWAEEGRPEAVRRVSWAALRARAAAVARALGRLGLAPGAAVAVDMPMSCDAVAIYLGIVLRGCVVVSIADSFAPSEISARLRISRADMVFTQDLVLRGGRPLPLYARVREARAPRAVVLPAAGVGSRAAWDGSAAAAASRPSAELRPGDLGWAEFLFGGGGAAGRYNDDDGGAPFRPCSLPGGAPSNILFSSGTTGEPKAIVWSHVTPLRAAVDAWAHQDVKPGDVLCWPTNLGWMMGPWLVYGGLVNGATVAVYHGAPGGADFCAFVAAARVTQLGLVPSIVRSWRASPGLLGPPDGDGDGDGGDGAGAAAAGAAAAAGGGKSQRPRCYFPDWSALRCFSSTGEASAPDDYHWLASRVRGYRPVIEYCGGTEIGGGFLSGTLLQPQAASAFSTPTLGAALVLLGSGGGGGQGEGEGEGGGGGAGERQSMHGIGAPPFVGELTLVPPLLGSSQHLLNRDHAATYYAGMPRCLPPPPAAPPEGAPPGAPSGLAGRRLRRHGDEFARLPGGYYQALGRVDDTMNLGGIKVSSAEIERCVLERVPAVSEAAAVGVPAPGGGPERLVLFLVLAAPPPSSSSSREQQQQQAAAAAGGAAAASSSSSSSSSPAPAPLLLLEACRRAVREGLNPLFRVHAAALAAALPRTASGKVVRRELRERAAAMAAAAAGGGAGPRSRM